MRSKNMFTLSRFLLIFMMYGLAWFFIFSVQVNKEENIFLVLQKTLNLEAVREKNERTKNTIHKEQVIDALSKAFKQ